MVQSRGRKGGRGLASGDMSHNLRPKRISRTPASMKDMVYNTKKKTIQHVRLSNKKMCDLERHSNDDSGYDDSGDDHTSLSSAQSPIPEDLINDFELESVPDDTNCVSACQKVAIVRPLCVAEAESDSEIDNSKAKNTKANRSNKRKSECSNALNVQENSHESESQSPTHSTKRMLMKEWMLHHLKMGSFTGLKWYDQQKMLCQITWKHRSANAWTPEDVKHFEEWARHTGRHEQDRDFKRWKANFRCALNILPDIQEVGQLRNAKGKNPYKVYQFLDNQNRTKRTKSCSSGSSSPCSKQKKRQQPFKDPLEQEADEIQLAVKQIQPELFVMSPESITNEPEPVISQTYDKSSTSSYINISSFKDPTAMLQPWLPSEDTLRSSLSLSTAFSSKKNGFESMMSSSAQSSAVSCSLPSVTTLLHPLSSTESTLFAAEQAFLHESLLCTPTEPLFAELDEMEGDSFMMTPEPVDISGSELYSFSFDDSEAGYSLEYLQTTSTAPSTFELPSATASPGTLPLFVEEMNSE